jgi:TRAP transporter TAXI family solute receptor
MMTKAIEIGTSAEGTVGNAAGAAIAGLLRQKAHLQAAAHPTAGQTTLLPMVNGGELDLAIANVLEVAEAVKGIGAFAGRRQSNLRVLCTLFPNRTGFFVRASSDIRRIEDLKGKRVTYGFSAMASMRTLVAAILANGGLALDDIRPVTVANANEGIAEFINGNVDAFYSAPGAPKVGEADAIVGGLRLVSLSREPAAIAAMNRVFPEGFALDTRPGAGVFGVSSPTQAMAYDMLLIAGGHVSEDLAYAMTKTIAEHHSDLEAARSEYKDFGPQRMAKSIRFDFHPGAVKYYQEQGLWKAD